MAIIFLTYLAAFFFILKRNKTMAYISFALSTILSVAMFLYHTNSTLNLNF